MTVDRAGANTDEPLCAGPCMGIDGDGFVHAPACPRNPPNLVGWYRQRLADAEYEVRIAHEERALALSLTRAEALEAAASVCDAVDLEFLRGAGLGMAHHAAQRIRALIAPSEGK